MSHNTHKQEEKSQKTTKQSSQVGNQQEEDIFAQQPSLTDAARQARLEPAPLSPSVVQHLQPTIGNRAAQRLQQSQEQDDETAQSKPNPQPFQWLSMGETQQRQTKSSLQRQKESRIQTDSVGESGSVQIREQSRSQELVVQRVGAYPDGFDKQEGDIAEVEWGRGKQIKFGGIDSCLGLVARKGDILTGVHLSTMDKNSKWIWEYSAKEVAAEVKRIIGSYDNVVYIGKVTEWPQGNTLQVFNALKKAIPLKNQVNGGGSYTAGVKDSLLHIGLNGEEKYTETPASKWPCFITTACVEAKGLPDDCYELTTLRAFRDEYMSTLPYGQALIAEYYRIAPQIIERIKQQPESAEILKGLYSRIAESVEFIRMGENEKAMQTYCTVVLELNAHYLAPGLSADDNALQNQTATIQPHSADVRAAPDSTSHGHRLKTPDWDELVSLLGMQQ